MEAHKPELYIAGVYIPQTKQWVGDFHATMSELVSYAERDCMTIAEFDLITLMVLAQQEYEDWWYRVQQQK